MSKIDILKHGEFYKKKFKFTCQCGCIFTVEMKPNERDHGLRFVPNTIMPARHYSLGYGVYYDCPECSRGVGGEELDPE